MSGKFGQQSHVHGPCLDFPLPEYIPKQFEVMKATNPVGTVFDLMDYFQEQWLDNWNLHIQTMECLLKSTAHLQQSLNICPLIRLLHLESDNKKHQGQSVSNVIRYRRKKYQKTQDIVIQLQKTAAFICGLVV